MQTLTELFAPRSIKEFSVLLAECGEHEKHFIAGGTDWLIKNRRSLSEDAVLFDLSKIPELRGIEKRKSSLRLGSMETMTSIHTDPEIRLHAAALCCNFRRNSCRTSGLERPVVPSQATKLPIAD